MDHYCCLANEKKSPAEWQYICFQDALPTGALEPAALLVWIDSHTDRKQAVRWLREHRPRIPFFTVDVDASVDQLELWMELGAESVLNPGTAFATVQTLTRARIGVHLLGQSPEIASARDRIALVAPRRCSVLIEGETGTGKEVAARSIHEMSDRKNSPFVTVNCAAIPETLLEAELFGHVKGAFTGALQTRIGKFEAANKGTIFLDEIGEMPMAVQSKLLRVLQQKEVERLGGNGTVQLDIRIVAATNAKLEQMVRQGTFRQDLYYRLNVVRLELAPLRNRQEDIPLLAMRFLQKACAAERVPWKCFDSSAIEALRDHDWPGNVRELENSIEAAVALSGDRRVLTEADFDRPGPFPVQSSRTMEGDLPSRGFEYNRALEEFERDLLSRALAKVRGNKTAAAQLLGLKRTTLAAKLRILENRMPRLVA